MLKKNTIEYSFNNQEAHAQLKDAETLLFTKQRASWSVMFIETIS